MLSKEISGYIDIGYEKIKIYKNKDNFQHPFHGISLNDYLEEFQSENIKIIIEKSKE